MMTGPGWFLQRMWWRVPWRHLSEDRLLTLALDTTDESSRTTAKAASHLHTCEPCANRFSALTPLLKRIRETGDGRFEEVFTPERLRAQRVRIGHRLAQLVGRNEPARVLAFPFCARPIRQVDFRPGRWLAVTAAAGLLLGVTVGQLIHYHPVETQTASSATLDPPAGAPDLTGTIELPSPDGDSQAQASPITLDEFERLMTQEEFLGDLDLSLTSFQVSALESIDTLTPRIRDRSINIR